MKRLDYNFSEYQESFNKIARKIVCESYDAEAVSDQIDEAQVTYNKIQKILNCPEMIKSHAYLYALDMENVDECDKQKVDKLYELGKARGVIQEDLPEQEPESDEIGECGDFCDNQICGGPADALTGQEMTPVEPKPAMSSAAYTVLYSAMKDGQVKTGEYFSSATDSEAARADCISNLTPLGYSNIRVLGIEQANDAVDTMVDVAMIDEDDSKEFEEQETGSGDTTEKPDEKPAEEPKKKDGNPAEEHEKKDEKPAEEPKEEPNADEPKKEPKDEPKEEPNADEPAAEPKELTPTEKQVLRDEYVGMFKAELQKTKLEKSVGDMTVKEKAAFWNTIAKKWTKQDPEEFLSDKEIEKLNNTVIKNS